MALYFSIGDRTKLEDLIPLHGKFFTREENSVIRFVSFDSKKRGADAPSLVIHTSVDYGERHMESNKEDVGKEIMDNLRTLYPSLPEPVETKTQRWRYSQVSDPVPGAHNGAVTLLPSTSSLMTSHDESLYRLQPPQESSSEAGSHRPFLVFCGDSFCSQSNFDQCVRSARTAWHLSSQQLPSCTH